MSLRSLLPRIMHRGWTGSNAIHTFSALITRGTRNYCPCTSNTNEHLETLSWSRNLQLSMKELYPWKKMLLHDAVNVLAIGCTRMPDGTAAQAHHPLIQIAIFLCLPHQLLYLFPSPMATSKVTGKFSQSSTFRLAPRQSLAIRRTAHSSSHSMPLSPDRSTSLMRHFPGGSTNSPRRPFGREHQ
jgi:hypothetical protein